MALRLAALGLALCVAISYAGVVRQDDDFLFDTIQSFLVEPESYASALGFSRVKRSSGDWDKEFNLNTIGAVVKIKYTDPNNQLKGGKAQIDIENLKKYVKRARSTKVHLLVTFDGGDSPKDGLFSLKVEYELHHNGVEEGVFTFTRSKSGGQWMADMENKNTKKPNGKPIFTDFRLKGQSDWKTSATGDYKSVRNGDYDINVKRVPGKSVEATIEGQGKKYVFTGQRAVVGNMAELKFKVNLGNAGVYSVDMSIDKEKYTNGKLDIKFNDRDFASLKLKGKLDKMAGNVKYEVRYTSVAFGDGKLRFARTKTANGAEMKAQYLPKQGLDLKFEGKRSKNADNSMNLHALVTRGGENYLEYNIDLVPDFNGDNYDMTVTSQFDVNEKSLLNPIFCQYGCFKKRSLNAKMTVNKAKPYKVNFDVHLFKDSQEVLTIDIDTRQSPYKMYLIAPRILPKILPTGRESIKFDADHVPGQYLHVKSNTNALSSFNVDKLANGNRKIELNGKELVQGNFQKGDNSISQTTTLPDGRSLTTTISWEQDSMKKNKVKVKLDGTERQLDAKFDWDLTNPAKMTFKGEGEGQNKRWGKYKITRDIMLSSDAGVLKMDLKGDAKFDKFWMPNPVKTIMNVMLDTNNKSYKIDMSKDFNGKKFGLLLNNGKLSLTL